RRIESMRVIRDLPEIEEKILEGSYSLTTVAAAGSFMRKRHYSRDEKRALLARVEHKSKRETESLLAEIDPEFARRDSEKLITEELVEIRMTMPKAVLKKLERVKELSSHRNPNPSYSELLELLADAYLKKNEKPAKPVQASPEKRVPTASVRAEILRRAGSACEFVSSGKRCESRHLLQVDHILPWAMGGRTEPANLRLLCFTHNQLEMRRKFGNSPIAQAPPAMAN
ncbi:MAG: HNH endonuclease, partial [Bdellovibrionota bacterium]